MTSIEQTTITNHAKATHNKTLPETVLQFHH